MSEHGDVADLEERELANVQRIMGARRRRNRALGPERARLLDEQSAAHVEQQAACAALGAAADGLATGADVAALARDPDHPLGRAARRWAAANRRLEAVFAAQETAVKEARSRPVPIERWRR